MPRSRSRRFLPPNDAGLLVAKLHPWELQNARIQGPCGTRPLEYAVPYPPGDGYCARRPPRPGLSAVHTAALCRSEEDLPDEERANFYFPGFWYWRMGIRHRQHAVAP